MLYNSEMKRILGKIDVINDCDCNYNLIDRKFSSAAEYYYCISEGVCLKDRTVSYKNTELSDFEWDGNEIYITSSVDITSIVKEALIIMEQLKSQMINEFKETAFDIILSVDLGDNEIPLSSTVRFYAIRDNYHIVESNTLEDYSQPLLIMQINR